MSSQQISLIKPVILSPTAKKNDQIILGILGKQL